MSSDITVAGDPLAAPPRLAVPVADPVTPSVARMAALARRHAASVSAAPGDVEFDPVTRWYRRLAALDDLEVWLLSWLPGQGTGRHDHGGSAGVYTVVSGALHERALVAGPLRAGVSQRVLTPGPVRVSPPGLVHEVVNAGTVPAVSVHVYAPRLTSMTMYPGSAEYPASTDTASGDHAAARSRARP